MWGVLNPKGPSSYPVHAWTPDEGYRNSFRTEEYAILPHGEPSGWVLGGVGLKDFVISPIEILERRILIRFKTVQDLQNK